ncbi:MAG TPA: winged helix DNA-binding domain-containing protein [Thermoanaerobaculia bacterium]|nr:winged helix DNA-binding domain-containing protein [Thermoanaerobaculia bacterium]
MTTIPAHRLASQLLANNPLATPHAVVSHFGTMQAQDYLGALWAVGARMRSAVESDVERALAERKIVRCWPMRGTLHFVAAEDVRWILELLAPRVLKRHRLRLERDFELDAKTLRRCRTIVERELRGGNALTRPEIYAALQKSRIATTGSRGLHMLFALAHEFVICFGARRGKQPTFVLLDEWLPDAKSKSRDESLAELARRYFNSHGPATIADFMWWSGLTMKEAKEAIALGEVDIDHAKRARMQSPHVQLLPPFDEYTVAYRDRSAVLDPAFTKQVNAGGGIFKAIVVIDGIVIGTWTRALRSKSVKVSTFRELTAREARAVDRAAERYKSFVT